MPTEQQLANLARLATKLESLPADYRHFNMGVYVGFGIHHSFDADAIEYARHNGGLPCGTAACAAGHGPSAGILVPPQFIRAPDEDEYHEDDDDKPDLMVDWNEYCEHAFGCGPSTDAYDWMFSGSWVNHDNHHYGAAARIRYYLANGVPGQKYRDEQMELYEPYRVTRRRPLPSDFYTSLPLETQELLKHAETQD